MEAPYQIDSVKEQGGAHHIELSPLAHAVFGEGLPQRGRIDLFIEDSDAKDAWIAAQKTGQGVTVTFALTDDDGDAPERHKHHGRHAAASASPLAYGEASVEATDEDDDEDEVAEEQSFGQPNASGQPYNASGLSPNQPYNDGGLSPNQPLTATSSRVGTAREEVNDSPRSPRARQARKEQRGE